jgi:hypothetical protein
MHSRIDAVNFIHRCGAPLTGRFLTVDGQRRVKFYSRHAQLEITHCPQCKEPLPAVSADEFLEQVWRSP